MSIEAPDQRAPRLKLLRDALESGTLRRVQRMVNALHPAEIADLLESLPPAERDVVWDLVDTQIDGDVLVALNEEVRAKLVGGMDAEELIAATDGMDLDDLADLVPDLPEAVTRQVIQSMDHQDRERLRAVMAYAEDTAGGLMDPDVVTVRPDVTLEVVLRYLRIRGELPAGGDALYVVNRYGRYVGYLYLTSLLTSDPSMTVAELMDASVEGVPATIDASEVASLFETRDLVTAPVVDSDGRLLGRITIDDVVDVIREEAEHSIL